MTNFIHLHLHSEYSISDGIVRIDQLIAAVKKSNMPAVAITDQSNLFGLVKFYREATNSGIKPIIGAEVRLTSGEKINDNSSLILLAQNSIGYKNLVKLLSKAYIDGIKFHLPTIQKLWLENFSDGLIVLSGGRSGEIGKALLANQNAQAIASLQYMQKNFPDRFYLEISRTGRPNEEEYLQKVLELADKYQVPVVATNEVCFLESNDFEAHEARVSINSGHVLSDLRRPRLYSEQQYLRSVFEMQELFADIPEAIANTSEIAKRCNVEITLGKIFLPIFPVESGVSLENYFVQHATEGLNKRIDGLNVDRNIYFQRLEYELKVIVQMGFASYFLIVADFIHWAKENSIPVGPGRGSGAGSLVAYALKITDLDPIAHELLFERFLNPERISMPDFDIDFCMEGRDRVIGYVTNRYGKDKVAQIITYGTMAARAVVRDVGRVLGMPYGFVDKLAKLIPFELGISLEKALKDEALLKQRYDQEEEVKTLIDLALKLEGLVRNAGKHAGGVVIAPSALTDFMPLYSEASGEGVITQFDKDDVEAVGLVKFDFLGLRTLTIIDHALKTINAKLKKNNLPPIDIVRLPLDDKKTFDLLRSCATTAVFQLESRGMKDLIKRLIPDCFDEIVALVALFRPGPMHMVDEFIDRKHQRIKMTYLHPKLEPILRQTYGVMLYQEQVMQIAQSLAGYSLGQADILRRAMGKKKPEEMAKQRAVFLDGAERNGIDKHIANNIFDIMEKFAGYGFNKSHSAAYALIAYQTAWLKAHFPAEFMAAVLSSDMDNTDKVVIFLDECKAMNLIVTFPNINICDYQFTVNEQGEIIYGLGAIKGVGQSAAENILQARIEKGVFKNLFDFCGHVDIRKVNKKVLEALIFSGALDSLAPNRATLLVSLPKALKVAEQNFRNRSSGQIDLFGAIDEDVEFDYIQTPELSKGEILRLEKSVLGFYLSGHPIEEFLEELNCFSQKIKNLVSDTGRKAIIAGFISDIRIINTKSNNKLVIVTLEDDTGKIDVTVFGDLYAEVREILIEDSLIVVEGEVGIDGFTNNQRVRASNVVNLVTARNIYAKSLLLKVASEQLSQELMSKLAEILLVFPGNCPVYISYKNADAMAKLQLSDKWRVNLQHELLHELSKYLGKENVMVNYSAF